MLETNLTQVHTFLAKLLLYGFTSNIKFPIYETETDPIN